MDRTSAPPTTDAQPRSAGDRLPSLTGLRFFAAMLVVALHSLTNRFEPGWNGLHLSPLAGLGYTGVTFFYVLSGFVLTWTWRPGLRRRTFYGRRFARIYPLHLLTSVAAVVVFLDLLDRGPQLLPFLSTLVLVQAFIPVQRYFFAGNGPSWSLSCEAFFYALLPVLVPVALRLTPQVRRRLGWACGAGFAGLAALAVLAGVGNAPLLALWVFPPYRVLQFAIGVLLALAVREGWRPRWSLRTALWASVLGYGVASLVTWRLAADLEHLGAARLLGDVLALPLVALLVPAAACTDLAGRRTRLASPLLVRLGDWSFALYLSHSLVLLELKQRLGTAAGLPGAAAREVLFVVLAVALAGALHEGVERPLERRIRDRVQRADPALTPA
jgi:peptidoglycan/LPS O-acetylase OafA/YrhL